MPLIGSGLIQAANTFVGAYDAIPSIAAAYSTRRLLTSYTGPLLRLVADRTGYPEQDIGYTAAGDLDTATAASFLSGDTGYITKWYDQGGNSRDIAQATLANMPLYVASGQNSKPVLQFDGSNDYLSRASFMTDYPVENLSISNGSSTTGGVFSDSAGVSESIYLRVNRTDSKINAVGQSTIYSASVVDADTEVWGINSGRWENATSRYARRNGTDGTIATGNAAYPTASSILVGRQRLGAFEYHTGGIAELIIATAIWSTPNRSAAETAANSYWSIY